MKHFYFCVICCYVTLLLNRELVNGAKLCLVNVFSDIVKDCPSALTIYPCQIRVDRTLTVLN